jgi:hypothetical protein
VTGRERCACPYLAGAATIDRLLAAGTGAAGYTTGRAVIIGLLRDRHGCPGPDASSLCPWLPYAPPMADLKIRTRSRPLYRGEDDSGDQSGVYL